jgi:cation diffusion facilitator CzcD-associated flavoprotein CzcO
MALRRCKFRYSLSTDPSSDWKKEFASGQEIFSYWKGLVRKYKLEDHLRFNRNVDECRWDPVQQLYRIKSSDKNAPDAPQVEDSARVVISAIGAFVDPQFPALPGRKDFKGDMWHSSRWNHDKSLSGKKVAVVGNACSAVQLVPVIAKDESTQIVNFCRSPQWLVPLVC